MIQTPLFTVAKDGCWIATGQVLRKVQPCILFII